jgi:hypothetical protein
MKIPIIELLIPSDCTPIELSNEWLCHFEIFEAISASPSVLKELI